MLEGFSSEMTDREGSLRACVKSVRVQCVLTSHFLYFFTFSKVAAKTLQEIKGQSVHLVSQMHTRPILIVCQEFTRVQELGLWSHFWGLVLKIRLVAAKTI